MRQVVGQSPLATSAAGAAMMPKATRSGACRSRRLGAAGKVVLAAVVHQETVLFDDNEQDGANAEDDEQFQSASNRQQDSREDETTATACANSGKILAEEPPTSTKENTHDDDRGPSLSSKFSRLFTSKKKQKRQHHLIDSTQANRQHHHHQSSCPSSASTTLRGQHRQYQLAAQSVAGAATDDEQSHRRTQTMSNGNNSNNKNDSEQVIEFKFDLIVDPAAQLAERGNEPDAGRLSSDDDGGLMKGKLSDNVDELVESFVLDSNDVCLMSTGRHQATTNLNNRYHSESAANGDKENPSPESQRQQQNEFDYLSQLAAHTLAYSFGLLNSKECSSNKALHPSHSEADDDDVDDDDELPVIGNKFAATTTTPNGHQRHSIEISATLFLSSPLEDARELTAEGAPPTRSSSKFSIFDLLDENEAEEEEEGTNDQQRRRRPMANRGADDLATNCDRHNEQHQQHTTAAKNSPTATSIDCLCVDDALANIEKVKSKLKRLLSDQKGHNHSQKSACAESQPERQQPTLGNDDCNCKSTSSMRSHRRAEWSSLLLISFKLKQRINGGLFSNRMCLIDFDPKFIELHSIFESIFNGQALAYLKRHKIQLRTFESKLAAATEAKATATDDKNNVVVAGGGDSAGAIVAAAAQTAAKIANDSSLARTNEFELKQHHQVASYTNKLIQAEWLLYKQLSSALIRTLIIVHVHKLSVLPLPSISSSDLILLRRPPPSSKWRATDSNSIPGSSCEHVARDAAEDGGREELIALTNKRNYIECQQRRFMSENLILLEFARSIQRASAIRLKRRKRHLKSHLASSNVSVASNISATTPTAPNYVDSNRSGDLFSSPFRLRHSSANRRANRIGGDERCFDFGNTNANDDGNLDYERYEFDYDTEFIERHQFGRKYSMETSLAGRQRHRHHHHRHQQHGEPKHHYLQRQHYSTIDNDRQMVSSSSRQLSALAAGAHSDRARQGSHTVHRNHHRHQPASIGGGQLLQAADCQTESSSISTSSGSQPTTRKIRSARSSRADSHRFALLQDNGLPLSATLNGNFSDSDSITSANLNSCSSSSYNNSCRLPAASHQRHHSSSVCQHNHHSRPASSRPRRDVELRWLAKQSRLVHQPRQSQFAADQLARDQQRDDQLELNLMSSPVGLFSSSGGSPSTPPTSHRRSSSVSRIMSSREASLVGSVIQIDCHRSPAYQAQSQHGARAVMSDCQLSQDEEGVCEPSFSSFLCSSSSLNSQQHTLTRLAYNLQPQSIQVQSNSDNEMEDRTIGGLEDNADNVSDVCSVVAEPPKQLKLEEFLNQLSSIIAPVASSASTTSDQINDDNPNQQQRQQQQQTKRKDSSSQMASRTSSKSTALVDEDEEDCKSHSSILEHLSSLAMESNSKLNNRQQQQCSLDRQSYSSAGRHLSLEIGDHEHDVVDGDTLIMRDQQFTAKAPTGHLQRMLNNSTRRGTTNSRVLLADPPASVEDKLRALTISCQQQGSPSSPSASSGAFTSSNDSSCSSSSSVVAEHNQNRRAIPTIGGSPLSKSNKLKSQQQGLYASVIRSYQNVKI